MQRFKMIASSYLFLIRNGQILLSRRFQTGYEDGKYSVPAGHLEDGETLTQALVREVSEEIGLVLDEGAVRLVHVMHRREEDIRLDIFFTIDKWSGEPKNMEPEKCDDLSWFQLDRLPKNTIPYIRTAIKAHLDGRIYSERF